MTKEQKINWLEQATNEEILNEFAGRVRFFAKNGLEHPDYFEMIEEEKLIRAELLKRLSK